MIYENLDESEFTFNDVPLNTLLDSPNGSFLGDNVGRAQLYPSVEINNHDLCLRPHIRPLDIISNKKYLIGSYQSPEVFLHRFDNCLIPIKHGVIVPHKSSNFFGPSAKFLNKRPMFGIEREQQNFFELPNDVLKKRKKVDTALIFHTAAVNNYYHWNVETLPLLFALKEQILSKKILPIWSRKPNKFQLATLQALGLGKAIKFVKADLIEAKRAYWGSTLKSFPNSQFSPLVAETFNEMKRASLSKTATTNVDMPKTLQIIRPGMGRRPLVNEAELTKELSALGCQAIDPGSLSYDEQISLFSNAKLIIGQHGGALTNIGFCSPGTKLLEIVGEHYVNPCFWGIAHISGVKYAANKAQTIDREQLKNKNAPAEINIPATVDNYKSLVKM